MVHEILTEKSMRHLHDLRTERLYPTFYCNSFIVLDFPYIYKSFDLVFCVWSVSWIEVLFCLVLFIKWRSNFSTLFVEKMIDSLLNCLCNFVENQLVTYVRVYFYIAWLHWFMCLSFHQYYTILTTWLFTVNLETM